MYLLSLKDLQKYLYEVPFVPVPMTTLLSVSNLAACRLPRAPRAAAQGAQPGEAVSCRRLNLVYYSGAHHSGRGG